MPVADAERERSTILAAIVAEHAKTSQNCSFSSGLETKELSRSA